MSYYLAAGTWANQYTDTGWFAVALTVLLCLFVLYNIALSHKKFKEGKTTFIRRIAGLNSIDEAVGRATEMGRPVLMVPGLGGLGPVVVQALTIFSSITRTAAKFANPIILCCADAAVYTVAQETIRDVYQSEGLADRYDPSSVRFVSDRQFAFAAGVSGIILRDQVAATFFMGDFYAESLIFAETANMAGAIQIASSTQTTQTPFFIASCDYVLIGDEFYAASAYLSREPTLTGSMTGQDWCKMMVIFLVVLGAIINTQEIARVTFGPGGIFNQHYINQDKQHSAIVNLPAARPAKSSDSPIEHLFNPQDDPSLQKTIVRDQNPPDRKGASD